MRLPYGKLKRIYDTQFETARPLMFDIWESDYGPLVVRESLSLLTSELHRTEVISSRNFLSLNKDLFTSRAGQELLSAKHERTRYERLDR